MTHLPADLQPAIQKWADEYQSIHAVAHWDDQQRQSVQDYDESYDDAAEQAEKLLATAGSQLLPRFLDFYPAIVWEDSDECLEVTPEDIVF